MIEIITDRNLRELSPPSEDPEPTITIYQSGRIRLSRSLATALGVAPDDHVAVAFMAGADHITRGYIAREIKGGGFKLLGGNAPYFNRIDLVRLMAARLDLPIDKIRRIRLRVATAPVYINGFHMHEILTT